MKKVILTVILDGPIPAVTKQDIAEQCAEKLNNLEFIYSVMPEIDTSINEVNKEPISSELDTFGDIDDAIEDAKRMQQSMSKSMSNPQVSKEATLGRASEEQGGNRSKNKYNTDRDPFND